MGQESDDPQSRQIADDGFPLAAAEGKNDSHFGNDDLTHTPGPAAAAGNGITAPLRLPSFRNIWLGSLVSNLGLMIQAVGAAWMMTQLTRAADLVALVQTAAMLPGMFLSLAAGAIADMYDRRIVALVALTIMFTGASALATTAYLGLINPPLLLGFCFIIGSGMALFGPSWAASVSEQVPGEMLASAVALNSISFNIARSFGPALGGIIVAAAGASAAFLVNAVCYLPLFVVFYRWRRQPTVSRLPPERMRRAIVTGARYVLHSPSIRVVLVRTVITGVLGSSISALMPLVARDMLGGGASMFGVMLGAFGMGAVGGALSVAELRRRLSSEQAARLCALVLGAATLAVAASRWPPVTAVALFVAGGAWMVSVTTYNIGVQLPAPRWVSGRAIASFQTAIAAGVALGSWMWGHIAEGHGVAAALFISGGVMIASAAVGLWLRLPAVDAARKSEGERMDDPEVRLALTARSGPIVVEIEYRVDLAAARQFHGVMQAVQLSRQRNGAYGWSLARDVAEPELWTERYHCPTWLDYLRQRSRLTEGERELTARAIAFHMGPEPIRIRRMLERPFGSVRWKEEAPDQRSEEVLPL